MSIHYLQVELEDNEYQELTQIKKLLRTKTWKETINQMIRENYHQQITKRGKE